MKNSCFHVIARSSSSLLHLLACPSGLQSETPFLGLWNCYWYFYSSSQLQCSICQRFKLWIVPLYRYPGEALQVTSVFFFSLEPSRTKNPDIVWARMNNSCSRAAGSAHSLLELSNNRFNPIFHPLFISPSSSDRSDDPKSGRPFKSQTALGGFQQNLYYKQLYRRYGFAEDAGNVKLNTRYKIHQYA